MLEKKWTSVFMYQESSKIDIEKFNRELNIKYKFDKLSLILLIIGIVSIFLNILSMYFIVLTTGSFCFLLFHRRKVNDKRKLEKLDLLEKIIIKESKGFIPISAVYPVYLSLDNKNKIFTLFYQDKEYIKVEYEDILSYDIYIDRTKAGARLPELPDPRMRSYIIEITFKDNKKAEIGFSNNNKYFLLNGKYTYLQYANTKSINKLATVFDKIIKNKRV